MGNCIRKESPMQWADEDWGSPAPETHFSGNESMFEDITTKGAKGVSSPFSSSTTATSAAAATTKLKIRITKKKLEELLDKMEVQQGLTVQQLLTELMNVSDQFEDHKRSWRPTLQSIPEII